MILLLLLGRDAINKDVIKITNKCAGMLTCKICKLSFINKFIKGSFFKPLPHSPKSNSHSKFYLPNISKLIIFLTIFSIKKEDLLYFEKFLNQVI